nr:citramalate synthase [Pelagibacteraceae bacterium]
TINGLGERCGNTNLISLIPSLVLKTNFNTNISKDKLKSLTKISNTLSNILNEPKPKNSPYVGENAFSHKGGLHASAVAKDPSTYEHINPDLVGNTRNVIISDQAGKANLLSQLDKLSIKIDNNELSQILELIKQKESEGFSYDVALASFELLVRRHIGQINEYFSLNKFRVTDERRWNAKGKLVTDSEATVHLEVKNEEKMTVGVGNGPVNAIDSALRQALINFYPTLNDLKLTDYKVMILSSDQGTGAITRVHIESTDDSKRHWTTVGVSSNIIDASYNAIYDSITYKLFNDLNN